MQKDERRKSEIYSGDYSINQIDNSVHHTNFIYQDETQPKGCLDVRIIVALIGAAAIIIAALISFSSDMIQLAFQKKIVEPTVVIDESVEMVSSAKKQIEETIAQEITTTDSLSANGIQTDNNANASISFPVSEGYSLNGCGVGDIVTIGFYHREEIEWIVLDVTESEALLISKNCVDCRPFHNSVKAGITWEKSDIREWLNSDFIIKAFSSTEQEWIQEKIISADRNPKYSTAPGRSTKDKIFLLSVDEANDYFSSDFARRAEPTAYAKDMGIQYGDNGAWWRLRTPGKYDTGVTAVYFGGQISYDGDTVNDTGCGIRPAMWISVIR